MTLRAQASFVAALACAAFGCAHSPDGSRTSQTSTTGASFALPGSTGGDAEQGVDGFSPASPELADPRHPANRLGTAACDRKLECDEIGDGKPHATQQACLTKSRRHAHEELDRLSCENGLDANAFDACVKAVRIAECAALDSPTSIDACNPRRLCAR